ncbi:MAG: hypothetical protein ACO3IB_15055, partial [Phycisphaerales bacterium]
FPTLSGFNALSPGLVMGLMILPLVSSLSEDAMGAVPQGLREGSYALGATRVPFWLAMAATPVGMFPRTAVVCFLASAARSSGAVDILSVYESAPKWAFWSGIAASVLVIFVIGRMAERALAQLAQPASGAQEGGA